MSEVSDNDQGNSNYPKSDFSFALIVVLFILLIIVGVSFVKW
ncbi:YjcZ family sporulation protein [Sporolactobacillus laevolacticus]|nr:YjcZ family sporulation protein [Sporolactobacillus laevolacticus]MDN3953781.1 YjcZ family sporulation protein [Sporolactobacillus laevolacticus]